MPAASHAIKGRRRPYPPPDQEARLSPMHSLAPTRPRPGLLLILCLLAASLWAASLHASTTPATTLAETIRREGLASRLLIQSEEQGDTARGSVDAIVDYPFDALSKALTGIDPWCEITFLHFNIKACVYREDASGGQVTLYSGRMHYLPPEKSFRNDYRFREVTRTDQQLAVSLLGEEGPFGTHDYEIRIEAAPLDAQRSLLRLSYSVSYGMLTRAAQRLYFATAGRHRIGFSTEDDKPIRGLRGMMERNTMRFYLALQAYLESPTDSALATRLARWHALTLNYPEQLRELPLEEYLDNKMRERANQQTLQQDADSG